MSICYTYDNCVEFYLYIINYYNNTRLFIKLLYFYKFIKLFIIKLTIRYRKENKIF